MAQEMLVQNVALLRQQDAVGKRRLGDKNKELDNSQKELPSGKARGREPPPDLGGRLLKPSLVVKGVGLLNQSPNDRTSTHLAIVRMGAKPNPKWGTDPLCAGWLDRDSPR